SAAQGVLADSVLARTAFYEGRFTDVKRWMDSLRTRPQRPKGSRAPFDYGMDPVLAATLHYALALWFLGDPHGARRTAATALAQARESGNPFFLCAAQTQAALVDLLCREPVSGGALAKQAVVLSVEQGFAYWNMLASALGGWAGIQQGQLAKGSAEITRVLRVIRAAGVHYFSAFLCAFLAEGRRRAGDLAGGIAAADEG